MSDICVLDRPSRASGAVERRRLRSRKAIREALRSAKRREVWILRTARTMSDLVRALAAVPPGVRHAAVICYERTAQSSAQMIDSGFERSLIGTSAMIPFDQLIEVLGTPHPEDYCIGIDWDEHSEVVAIWRGDLSVVFVPLDELSPRGGVAPDPSRLSVEDWGQTVRLGGYEVSVDAVLFERDPVYRRRAKKRMIAEETGLGPSIRRLRRARGLSRAAFSGLDEKTIARIERGEVTRPQARTLETIARVLDVPVDELASH